MVQQIGEKLASLLFKDDFRPELRTNGDEPMPPFIANQLSHGSNMCDIVCVHKIDLLAIGVKIGLRPL